MEATVLEQLTTVDQNTGRIITWNIDFVRECDAERHNGFTHFLAVSRPKGRRSYALHVELVGDVVVRHTSPTVVF